MDAIIQKYNSLELSKFRSHISKVTTENLLKIKRNLDNRYYNTGQPVIEDVRYDILVDLLTERGEDLKVGCKLREGDNKTTLPFYLGGMDKIKKGEDSKLKDWIKDNAAKEYVVSDKLNGVSCLVTYSDKGEIKLYTRGDCTEGADISYLAPMINSIPKSPKNIAVRGEFIMPVSVYNEKHTDKKNCLITIIGLINSKTMRDGVKDLIFIAYEIVDDKVGHTPSDSFTKLKTLGFLTARYTILDSISSDVLAGELERRKSDSIYEIDGLVVQGNVPYNRNNLAASGNPDYAFAFKMLMEVAEVTVADVEWNVSRHSIIKPRIRIKPVHLTGITIEYTSGFNAAYIKNNKINVGSKLLITRSGDIIPYIVQVLTQSEEPKMPDIDYQWNETGIDIIAKDGGDVVTIQKITHFFTTIGIKHVNEGLVKRFVDNGFDTILSILRAGEDDFIKIPGFQKKMSEKIFNSIHSALEEVDIANLMCASGVFGFGLGVKRAKLLCSSLNPLDGDITVKQLEKIEGFSEKTATRIVESIEAFRDFVSDISAYVNIKEDNNSKTNKLEGKKYVFSGFRDKELEEYIINNGGSVSTSISSKTTALIVAKLGEKSSKVTKAEELGIKIIGRDKFNIDL
jgi:NAD-dependent DNA ligase